MLHEWLAEEGARHPELRGFAVFGSYARGDWGVGSDLDLLAVVAHAPEPFGQRGRGWDTTTLPVPVDLLIYTVAEWRDFEREDRRFARELAAAHWLRPL